jgi:hypothetical protein
MHSSGNSSLFCEIVVTATRSLVTTCFYSLFLLFFQTARFFNKRSLPPFLLPSLYPPSPQEKKKKEEREKERKRPHKEFWPPTMRRFCTSLADENKIVLFSSGFV